MPAAPPGPHPGQSRREGRSAPPACRGRAHTRSAANCSTPQSRNSRSPAPEPTAVTASSTVSTKTETVAIRPGSLAISVGVGNPAPPRPEEGRLRSGQRIEHDLARPLVRNRQPESRYPGTGELERRGGDRHPGGWDRTLRRIAYLHREDPARYRSGNVGFAQTGYLEGGRPLPPPGGGGKLDYPLGGSDTQIADGPGHQAAPSSCGAAAYPSASIAPRTLPSSDPSIHDGLMYSG